MSCRIVEREKMKGRPYYVLLAGDQNGQWLRMEWRSDVPEAHRGSLLENVRP